MNLTFDKMQGLGNDFIVIEDYAHQLDFTKSQVRALCDRNFGIGADGVIVLRSATDSDADYAWWFANADGSLAEMCGNGIRCAARALFEKDRLAPDTHQVTIETAVGPRPLTIALDADGRFESAEVVLGCADFSVDAIGTTLEPNTSLEIECSAEDTDVEPPKSTDEDTDAEQSIATAPLVVEGIIDYPFKIDELDLVVPITCLSLGNPHTVIDVASLGYTIADVPVEQIGSAVETDPAFVNRTNVVFFEVVDEHTLNVRVWERGCGETLACGTGASAAAVTALIHGLSAEVVTTRLLGGDGSISIDPQTLEVSLSGPAELVYAGTIDVEV
jgi:diaminopimelate epimerase